MAKRHRRPARPAPKVAAGQPSNVVALADAPVPDNVVFISDFAQREYRAVLANVAGPNAPETGQRTPQPSITRDNRSRLVDLDLDRVVGILRKAEDGDVKELADLWLRMLKSDAHLTSVWESRTAPVYAARWEVTPPEVDATRVEAARLAADGCAEALRGVPDVPTLFSALLNARGLGYAVAEIIWCRGSLLGRPAWVPGAIKPIHGRRFRFSDDFELGLYDDGRACGALREAGWPVTELTGRGAKIARLPRGKYIVHQPIGIHDYPTSTGLVHSVARWWWVKQTVTKYWLGGAEMFANPRIIGEILQNSAGVTMDEFMAGLEKLAADGVMVHREGTKVNVVDGKAGSAGEVWDTLFRRMDLAMSKAILGSTLNVEVDSSGGNRAASESQDSVTIRPRQRQDASQLWTTIERDLFGPLMRFNPHIFAPNAPIPCGRSVIVEETVVIDQLAVDSGAVRVNEMRRRSNLPEIGGEIGQMFIRPITRGAADALGASPTPETAPIAPKSTESPAVSPV